MRNLIDPIDELALVWCQPTWRHACQPSEKRACSGILQVLKRWVQRQAREAPPWSSKTTEECVDHVEIQAHMPSQLAAPSDRQPYRSEWPAE